MARLFQINLPDGLSNVKLDSQGRATVQYTVKNVSARSIDGRAVLISLPLVKPPRGAVEKGWIKIDGKTDRHFDVDKEETFTVKIAVPPKSPAGTYTFRLDTVWVDQPDQGDAGGAIAFTVAAPVAKPTSFPLWLIPVIAVVVIGIGVGLVLVLRGPTVPDLTGKNVTDANTALQAVGMTLDETDLKTVESTPGNSGKIISQNPAAGQKGAKGQAVQVTLGAQMVAVPLLIGHQYKDVMGILSGQSLAVGQNKTAANPNFAAGVVFDQSPAPQQLVKSGTAVDVQVTPTTVTVTPVIGQTLGNASNALGAIGLRVTSLSGDSNLTVIGQNPGPGTTVPVGTPVALTFPPGTCVGAICYYNGIIAQQMVAEQAMRAKTGHW